MDTAKSAKERSRKKMNVIIQNIISSRVGRFGPIVLFAKTQTAAAPHQPTPHQQSMRKKERVDTGYTKRFFVWKNTCVRKSMCNNGYELRFTVRILPEYSVAVF